MGGHLHDPLPTSPSRPVPHLHHLAAALDELMAVRTYPEEFSGILKDARRPVQRLGLALEANSGTEEWIRLRGLDALLLHRHWALDVARIPEEVGVLAYHLPFDEHLTLGYNPLLAGILGVSDLELLGSKQGRPLGMIGRTDGSVFPQLSARLRREFGGMEDVVPPRSAAVDRIAVVGAMSDPLVREAAARGAGAYLTGQFRASAGRAVEETGIGVLATGHRRAEEWGLRALGGWVRRRWPVLEVHIAADPLGESRPC